MTISYNWLLELLPEHIELDQLSHILTSVGLEVESIEEINDIKGGLAGLVVGKILSAEKHPNADKLQVCMVDIGISEPQQIVCGAPNAKEGLTVIVATPGTTIFPTAGEPFTINKGKIRGEISNGMICGEDEIGLGTSHDGIVELPTEWKAGALVRDCYNISKPDFAISLGITPNHVDAMNHMGVAKNICAYLSNKSGKASIQKMPTVPVVTSSTSETSIKVNIADSNACRRYASVLLTNITVAESPKWLKQKLNAIGVKSINNVVDITNFVLQECGQPLHAFDAAAITSGIVNIQCLPQGTPFTTLDGTARKLQATDLMICNDQEPMCMAGIYGGMSSGVSEKTTSVFLESAFFDAQQIRKSSTHHGLRTDAAVRFEKGVDISQTTYALNRAAALLVEIAGATISSNVQDLYPNPITPSTVTISYERIRQLSGANYSNEKIKNILLHLCFAISHETHNELTLVVPFAKPDITMPADIVEEIMRIDGLNNVPFTGSIKFALGGSASNSARASKELIANMLVSKGFFEIFTNSISHSAFYQEQDNLVRMRNSLSAELDVMRATMLHSGLHAIQHNTNRKQSDIKFFEFGKIYKHTHNAFIEEEQLAIFASGACNEEHWKNKKEIINIYFAKGIVASIAHSLGIDVKVQEEQNSEWPLLYKKNTIGAITLLTPQAYKQWDLKHDVYMITLQWKAIQEANAAQKIQYTPLAKHPAARRDLALIIDKQINYAQVQKCISNAGAKLLKAQNVFDVFESEKLGNDKKSYAVSLTLSDPERTLTDAEIDTDINKIMEKLQKELGATIRA